MSTPLNIDTIVPTKYKAIVGLVGSLLTFALPVIVDAEKWLPQPWPVIIAGVLGVLTFFGIVKAPYVPEGAVLAPNTPAVVVAAQQAVTQAAVAQAQPGPRKSSWK
jgi:predicted anti-sigma-YlaC factor YlaD